MLIPDKKPDFLSKMKNIGKVIKRKPVKVIYVSTYIPRKCGIATYTKDLTNDINKLNPYALAEIMAVNRPGDNLSYPWEVKLKINQNDLGSYIQAANYANQSEADLIMLQHEYGIFSGNCGDYIIPFVQTLKKPLVTTFHTVLDNPNPEFGTILNKLAGFSETVTVMMNQTRRKLTEKFGIPKNKIVVIPHGTPDLPFETTEAHKKKKRLNGKIILGNINLLTPSRGIEYALEAVALIAKKYPHVLYLIIGQTHPVFLQEHGEVYRNFLKKTIKKLGIKNNVKFINEYISLEELISWLKCIDFYVTPYLGPDQSSSGALAYAIGAGKSCISTSYLYAQEALSHGRGVLVGFKDSKTIAEAVLDLLVNPEKKLNMEKKAYEYGRLMTWSSVALQHFDLFHLILKKNGKH